MKKTQALWTAGIGAVCLLGAGMTGIAGAADTKADEDEVTTKESEQLREQAAEKGAERGRPKESWIDPEPTPAQPESDGPVMGKEAEKLREQAAEKGAERGRPKESWIDTEPDRQPVEEEADEKKNGNGKKNGGGKSPKE